MQAVIRDAPCGQLVRFLTRNKYFQYPEEKPDFTLPEPWIQLMNNSEAATDNSKVHSDNENLELQQYHPNHDQGRAPISRTTTQQGSEPMSHTTTQQDEPISHTITQQGEPISHTITQNTIPFTEARREIEEQHGIEKIKSTPISTRRTKDGAILVDWYYTDDSENPHNWSNLKRALLTTLICLYTFVVYTTSAIYTSSEPGIMREFGVSNLLASLGLALYVLGYGTGPLIFSPMGEIPVIGRNPVYIVTMFLFVIISIPTAFVGNFPGLIVLRFLQGFFGSPCLASGGASIGDMYSLISLPYALMAWVAAAYCGRKLIFIIHP